MHLNTEYGSHRMEEWELDGIAVGNHYGLPLEYFAWHGRRCRWSIFFNVKAKLMDD